MGSGYRWLEVVPPGGDTALTLAKPYLGQKNVSVGGFSNVVLSCDNIIETYKELESRGVKFIGNLICKIRDDASSFLRILIVMFLY